MKRSILFIVLATTLTAVGSISSYAFDPPKESGSKKESPKPKESDDQDSAKSSKSAKATALSNSKKMKSEPIFNRLSSDEKRVILFKGTEPAWVGKYTNNKAEGTYICRHCNAPLYNSKDKFESHCGWPSFDDEIKGAVRRQLDADGSGRIEITCKNCDGHLGHVFQNEGFTQKNIRHCVNSISMTFIAKGKELPAVIKAQPPEGAARSELKPVGEKDKGADKERGKETAKPKGKDLEGE
ncbi:MAG: methionine-R-sulfoxide reductase [Pirellula sp.]